MTTWTAPTELPDLRRVGLIGLDTETSDEGLRADRGSAWPWRGGYVCGVSIAWRGESGICGNYLPLRHPDSETFERETVRRWLNDLIAAGVRFVTQNGLYDWGWLWADLGIAMPSAQLEEIGALATLVDENHYSYSLDNLCAWRRLPGKDTTLLREAVKTAGWLAPRKRKINVAEHIYKLPAHLVGPYAEADAVGTLALYEDLNPVLDREGARDAYRLDVDLLPMVHAMRRRGIRIDQDAAEQAREYCLAKRNAALTELSEQLGSQVSMKEIAKPGWKKQTFDAHGISYPRTEKGNPSFKAGKLGWMAVHPHWLPRGIATANKYNDAGTKFLEGHILGHLIGDRIYGEINPFRSENGGTKSFRFSYSAPPLQQMPSRDEELAPLIRRAFLPEEGETWCTVDCSQQEFRLVVHHAGIRNLTGAKEAVERYRDDPDTDFHMLAAEITGLPRKDAKAVNFAKIYGAGVKMFAAMIGKPLSEAQALYGQYDRALPFLSRLAEVCQREANSRGYTVLYDGARRHWDRWATKTFVKGAGPCAYDEAKARTHDPGHPWFGDRLHRVDVYTALNALIQGSAARHTKLWMRACWREGIIPMLQMHDGLECSVTAAEQGELIARLAGEAVELTVPMRAEVKYGRNWGDAKHTWQALHGGTQTAPIAMTPTPEPVPIELPPAAVERRICAQCRLDPPDGSERPSTYNGEWLHTRCQDAFLRARMAEQGIAWETPRLVAAAPAPAPAARRTGGEGAPVTSSNGAMPPDAQIALADLIDEPVPRSGLICCRFHDDNTPSLKIYDDHFHCFSCGAHGDLIDWLMLAEGLERAEAEDVLNTWDGPVAKRARDTDDGERTARALELWNAAKPIAGTLAARYLGEHRRIDLAALPADVDAVLRFHSRCPFGPGTWHPCLLVLMRDPAGDVPTGIQRTALTADARKIGRRMYGRAGVAKLWPAARQLVIGEGLETTLAAATRLPYRGAPLQPAWAALSAGALRRFPIIAGVERLILLADHDHNGEGQAAAAECKGRWQQAGRTGVLLTPERPGTDFNDVVIATLELAPS